jgi:hypothetical protein
MSKTAGEEKQRNCTFCDAYLNKNEGFVCPKCKRGPMCQNHRAFGRRECSSCAAEIELNEFKNLKRQERHIKYFLRLLEFFFIVFVILYVSIKIGLTEMVEFLQFIVINDYVDYIEYLGVLVVVGYLIFFIIMLNQKDKIREQESRLSKIEFRRLIK